MQNGKPATPAKVTESQLEQFAFDNFEAYRDEVGEVNLTALGEEAFVEFEMTEAQWAAMDADFIIWRALVKMEVV